MGSQAETPNGVKTRLDSWKSIAQYLGRSSRTVQRWHSGYGLPVRHLGNGSSSVFAYPDELDRWLWERHPKPGDETKVLSGAVLADLDHGDGFSDSFTPDFPAQPPPAPSRTASLSADLFNRAERMWETLSESNLGAIARSYRELVDLEPSSARAFAGLALALITEGVLCRLHMDQALLPCQAALRRAHQLDRNLFETRCADAWIKLMIARDWRGAESGFDELIQERPTSTKPLVGLSLLEIAKGNFARVSKLLREASVCSPLNASAATLFCWAEYLAGNFDHVLLLVAQERDLGHCGAILDAVEALASVMLQGSAADLDRLERLAASSPRHYALLGVLGFAYGKSGQTARARQVLEGMTKSGVLGSHHYAYSIALTHIGLHERDEAMEWLEESYRQGSLWSLGFRWDPVLADLRCDARCSHRLDQLSYPVQTVSNH